MTQTVISVVLFLIILALLPLAIRWYQQRAAGGAVGTASKVVSSLAVGPQQRVVTVETGPDGARVWLVLGVTPQQITCLHSMPAPAAQQPAIMAAASPPAGDTR